jgi:tetratricopeptide (TPR) repeat protein
MLREFGHLLLANSSAQVEAHVELAAGDAAAAEAVAREAYEELEKMGEQGFRSTVRCYLARALLELDRWKEAEEIAIEAGELGADDDFVTQSESRQIRALVEARRGRLEEAEHLAREAVAITEERIRGPCAAGPWRRSRRCSMPVVAAMRRRPPWMTHWRCSYARRTVPPRSERSGAYLILYESCVMIGVAD